MSNQTAKGTVGSRLKFAREAAELSQKELAAKVGVGFAHISKVERDREQPSAELIGRISKVLGLEGDMLILLTGQLPDWIHREVERDPAGAHRVLGEWATARKLGRRRPRIKTEAS